MLEQLPKNKRSLLNQLTECVRFFSIVVFSATVFTGVAYAVNYTIGSYGAGVYGAGEYGFGSPTSLSVSLTAPIDGATVSGNAVTISANASDDVSVSGVQFKLNTNTLIGSEDVSSAYSVIWDSTTVSDGSHTLIAVARDGAGNYATSSIVTVTVDNTAPVRSAGSPSGTLALNTTTTSLSLTTSEIATCKYSTSSGVAYGSMTAFSTTGSTSHSETLSGLSNGGSYVYYVKCSDVQSNTNAIDYSISFTVAADSTSPTVSITAPANNATVSGNAVTVSANASDDVSVSGVQFKLNTNTHIGSEDTTSAYSASWDTTAVANGSHTLIAVARDGAGNYATSSIVTVTVNNTSVLPSGGRVRRMNILTQSQSSITMAVENVIKNNINLFYEAQAKGIVLPPFILSIIERIKNSESTLPLYIFTRDLERESTGVEVKALQNYLVAKMSGPSAAALQENGTTYYFGFLTYNALVEYQLSRGIEPSVGYFGPITRAAINAGR